MGIFIRLFGSLRILDGAGVTIRLPTRKSEALLAYLVASQGELASREVLSDLLWPFSGPDQARASLRQEVSVLRKALGPGHAANVVSQGDGLAFDQTDGMVDLWQVRNLEANSIAIPASSEALTHYEGPFLGTFRSGSQPYSDWVWAMRQSLEATALKLCTAALQQAIAGGDENSAEQTANHLCRIDPSYEPAHCALIETHLGRGEIHLAKRQLRQCEADLKRLLDAEPSASTQALTRRLEEDPPNSATPATAQAPPLISDAT